MAEPVGTLIPTQIPTLSDSADIQEAFRLYHYGAASGTNIGEYDPSNANASNIVPQSIAGYINSLNVKVAALEASPGVQPSQWNAKGALVTATANSVVSTLSVPVGGDGSVLIVNSAVPNGISWSPPSVTPENTISLTNKTINLGSNTITGTTAQFNTALSDDNFVTLAGNETLTSKTLTSPVINTPSITGLYLSDSAGITFEGSSADAFETVLNVTDPTEDRTITLPNVSGTVITTGNLSSVTSIGTLPSLAVTGNVVYHVDVETITSTAVTAPIGWDGEFIVASPPSALVITLPDNATVPFPRGTQFTVLRRNANDVSFTNQNANVTILATPGRRLRAVGSSCTLIKLSEAVGVSAEWAIVGDLAV
jgi:hypothetical protein